MLATQFFLSLRHLRIKSLRNLLFGTSSVTLIYLTKLHVFVCFEREKKEDCVRAFRLPNRNLFCCSSAAQSKLLMKICQQPKVWVNYEEGIDDFTIVHIHVMKSILLQLLAFWAVDIARNEFRSISHVRIKWKRCASLVRWLRMNQSRYITVLGRFELSFDSMAEWWILSAMNFECHTLKRQEWRKKSNA